MILHDYFILVAIFLSLKFLKNFKSLDDMEQTTTSIVNGNYNIDIKKSYYKEF